MNCVSASWRIEHLPSGERSLKRFLKRFKGQQKETQFDYYYTLIDGLRESGIHPLASQEPLPGSVSLPQLVELWKIRFKIPNLSGSLSRLRIIYLRNIEKRMVLIVYVYTHKDYEKRPSDKVLAKLINGTLQKG